LRRFSIFSLFAIFCFWGRVIMWLSPSISGIFRFIGLWNNQNLISLSETGEHRPGSGPQKLPG
jgi:hypothetical protein